MYADDDGEIHGDALPTLANPLGRISMEHAQRILRDYYGPLFTQILDSVNSSSNGDLPTEEKWNMLQMVEAFEGKRKVCTCLPWGRAGRAGGRVGVE